MPTPASYPENGASNRLSTDLIDQSDAPRWTTIDSPVAGKVVHQSPHPAQFTPTSRSGTRDSPFVACLPVDPGRSPGQKKRTVASPINGHHSLMGELRPRATTLVTMT